MSESLPFPDPLLPPVLPTKQDEDVILDVLNGYKMEAKQGREEGPNPRDRLWRVNWDRYWGRYDHSGKAEWQSTHVMPETSQYVDRYSAALREALTQGGRWYSAVNENGESDPISDHIAKFMDLLLGRCSRTITGHPTDFASFFEDQMKLGALMQCCAAVTWKEDEDGGYVAVESVDPRECWFDPKGRNLYRLRTYPMDKYQLKALAKQVDATGEPIYNRDVVEELAAELDKEAQQERESSAGHSEGTESTQRKQIEIDEWLCTLLDGEGEDDAIATNQLIVVANKKYIIRGPEKNPFWHRRDWIVATPLVTVPFSVYGRSYVEDFAEVTDAYVELTNLILDGVFTSTMRAFAVKEDMLKDPTQLDAGISPNLLLRLEDGVGSARDFLSQIDLGTLPSESLAVWTALKTQQREAAKLNEIALGQVPSGTNTATEVSAASQSGSAMIRSMSRTVESRLLEPLLTLVFMTGLQHMDFTNPNVMRELGEETASMLGARKQEFLKTRYRFRVRGLSSLVDRQAKQRQLLSLLQVVSGNEILLQAFLQENDVQMLMRELMRLFGIDSSAFKPDAAELQMRSLLAPMMPTATPNGSPPRTTEPTTAPAAFG